MPEPSSSRASQRAFGLDQADGEIGGDLHLPAIRPQRRDLLLQHEEPVGVVLRLVVQQEGVGAGLEAERQRHPRGDEADAQQARHRGALRRCVAPQAVEPPFARDHVRAGPRGA